MNPKNAKEDELVIGTAALGSIIGAVSSGTVGAVVGGVIGYLIGKASKDENKK